MNMDRIQGARGAKISVADRVELLAKHHQENVARLERAAKERCMLAGSLITKQVSQMAALEVERAKLSSLKLKLSRFADAAKGPGQSATREAATQTEDDADLLLREEVARLRAARDRLRERTRGMPKNTAHMVELLKKRNAMLLNRKQRDLQRAKTDRAGQEQRVRQLQERLAALQARRS